MLRQTLLCRSAVFQTACMPRVMKLITPGDLQGFIIMVRERKKRIRYYGSQFHGFNDRAFMYGNMGNAKGGKGGSYTIIQKHHNRANFLHPGAYDNLVDVRTVKVSGDARYAGLGGFFRQSWDHSLSTTNTMQDQSLHRFGRCQQRDRAIEMVEGWGVKYVVLDEIRKPSLTDCKYHSHSLFANKFHWSPEPPTHHSIGDAEFNWKGDELIEYKDCGAHTKSVPRNTFNRSLWKRTTKEVAKAKA